MVLNGGCSHAPTCTHGHTGYPKQKPEKFNTNSHSGSVTSFSTQDVCTSLHLHIAHSFSRISSDTEFYEQYLNYFVENLCEQCQQQTFVILSVEISVRFILFSHTNDNTIL